MVLTNSGEFNGGAAGVERAVLLFVQGADGGDGGGGGVLGWRLVVFNQSPVMLTRACSPFRETEETDWYGGICRY